MMRIVRQADHIYAANSDPGEDWEFGSGNEYHFDPSDLAPFEGPRPPSPGRVPENAGTPGASPGTPGASPGISSPSANGFTPSTQTNVQGLQPDAQALRQNLLKSFPGSDIGGYNPNTTHSWDEHQTGQALDFMLPNHGTAAGDAEARKVMDQAFGAGANYVIFNGGQFDPNGVFSPYGDRGGSTQNHQDHVHINIGPKMYNPQQHGTYTGWAASPDANISGASFLGGTSKTGARRTADADWNFNNDSDRDRAMNGSDGVGGVELSHSPMAPNTPGMSMKTPKGQTFGGDPSKLPTPPSPSDLPSSGLNGSPSSGFAGAAVPPGSGAERWRPLVEKTLQSQMGQYGITPSNMKGIENQEVKQIQTESGGNPQAVNNYDSNAQAGHPSQGLLQFIPSSFNSYNVSHGQFMDPSAQIAAFAPYVYSRHGMQPGNTGYNYVGQGHGY